MSSFAEYKTLVILPTYCEHENLSDVIARVTAATPTVHILVVDDNSPDGTGEIAESLAADDQRIHVLRRRRKEGLGPAYIAGFSWALARGYAAIVEMDADGSHQPEQLPTLLTALVDGAGLAIGSRWIEGGRVTNWPWYRRAISRAGSAYARTLLGSRLHDLTSGYRAYRAEALLELDLSRIATQGYAFQIELAWRLERAEVTIVEVPIDFVERARGKSKMSARIVLEALVQVARWKFDKKADIRGGSVGPHTAPENYRN